LLIPKVGESNRRISALVKVLCSIPNEDYEKLKTMAADVIFFISNYIIVGCPALVSDYIGRLLYFFEFGIMKCRKL